MDQKIWKVESDLQRDEPIFEVRRPCPCGCDFRNGQTGVGYLMVSAGRGQGATIWIHDEAVFRELEEALKVLTHARS